MSLQSSHDRYDTGRHCHVLDAQSDKYVVIEVEMVRIRGSSHGPRGLVGVLTGYKGRQGENVANLGDIVQSIYRQ